MWKVEDRRPLPDAAPRRVSFVDLIVFLIPVGVIVRATGHMIVH